MLEKLATQGGLEQLYEMVLMQQIDLRTPNGPRNNQDFIEFLIETNKQQESGQRRPEAFLALWEKNQQQLQRIGLQFVCGSLERAFTNFLDLSQVAPLDANETFEALSEERHSQVVSLLAKELQVKFFVFDDKYQLRLSGYTANEVQTTQIIGLGRDSLSSSYKILMRENWAAEKPKAPQRQSFGVEHKSDRMVNSQLGPGSAPDLQLRPMSMQL